MAGKLNVYGIVEIVCGIVILVGSHFLSGSGMMGPFTAVLALLIIVDGILRNKHLFNN
ncbi:hypothetical protein [Methanobrevibacter sp.]|uniref:hypothetical protein n=1 Tax=Methanobrevibacter sp. TaxID=66852 RepID=UPI0026E1011F|nr:hypothetical protein [Methanobrevibacter sp.]MDO5859452.1 hypothetical protein [Methanobrevibacter sp.]